MRVTPPFNLHAWIETHRASLVPPVANRQVYPAGDFIIMVVGGPNARADYHVDPGVEFFHQLEGTLVLKTLQAGKVESYTLGPGDVFLLPPRVPHSPQRSAGSIGLVVERARAPSEQDGFQWYCPSCNALLYEEFFSLTNIETQFPAVFDRFYGNRALRTCTHCQTVLEPPAAS